MKQLKTINLTVLVQRPYVFTFYIYFPPPHKLDLREERWNYQYHLAKIFHEKHGYWTVPFKRNLDPSREDDATIDVNNLMNWIRVQKYYYQVGKLRPDRVKRLRSIGFPLADDDEKILPDLNIAGQKSNAEVSFHDILQSLLYVITGFSTENKSSKCTDIMLQLR